MITFVIFTYNEESRIERVIKNFKNYGNILIADNKSTDRTLEIARAYGCDVLVREKHYVFVENQEMVDMIYGKIDSEWIYWGFADEMLEKDTLNEIQRIITAGEHDIIDIDRKNYFYGQFCYDLYHARSHKIFKKGAIDFTDNVIHGMGKPVVSKDRIHVLPDKYFVHHFISNTVQSYLNVINTYTESELETFQKSSASFWYFIFNVLKAVIKNFYFNRGFKAGFSGLALTELMLFYALVKNIKHYEQNNKLTRKSIEDQNDYYRDKVLSSL
jgi:glycosyltransferase involved in cell wall biosynthesis